MKITAILLLAACLQVSARGFSQTVTLSLKNASLEEVFKQIKKQTGFSFIWNDKIIKQSSPIDISVKDATIPEVMNHCLQGQALTYEIIGKIVAIKEKDPSPGAQDDASTMLSTPPPIDVHGRIVNEKGEPVAGASVQVEKTNQGTMTDAGGNFILKGVDENAAIKISGTNIETIEVKIVASEKQRQAGVIDLGILTAKTKVSPLDEVQIIAYGTTTQRLSTENVATVNASTIEKQPVGNPLLALEGQAPGLFITQSTGISGGGVKVRIQGQNSLARGNDPLYVIDGVPYISQLLPNISGTLQILGDNGNTNPAYNPSGGGNPLSFLNPSDIESISILKDAEATSIYGSRAANGAILITTKKGKEGKTSINFNVQNGWGKVSRMLPLLNTSQYLAMRREAYKNDNIAIPSIITTPSNTAYDINGAWDTTRNTDWQKELIGGTAQFTDAQGSVSAGTSSTQFLFSAGYHRETSVFPGDLSDEKKSVHFNINHASLNKKFRFTLDGKYLVDNNNLILTDLTAKAIQTPPVAPALYTSTGDLNWQQVAVGTSQVSTWPNPLAIFNNTYEYNTNNLIGNSIISYDISKDLQVLASFGYTNMQTSEVYKQPASSSAPELRPTANRFAQFSNGTVSSWIVEPQMKYKKTTNIGSFDVVAGMTYSKNSNSLARLSGSGFSNDFSMDDIKSAATVAVQQTVSSTYKYMAVFGRLNYSYHLKFILNAALRRDGSSRFGSENLFHNFWSISGGYIFSNEKLMKDNLPWLSFGKLRVSYGTSGNDQIGDYQFLSLYNSYSVPVAYQGAAAIVPGGFSNPNLQWEETRKLQGGLDLGFLHDRILLTVNYYRNRSSNLLQNYVLPVLTGNNGVQVNFPAVIQNSGMELSLTGKPIDSKNFQWTVNANLTVPKNKLVDFPGLATSTYANIYVIGQPVTIKKVYDLIGVDPTTGLYQYNSKSGTVVSTPNNPNDKTVLINVDPKFYGGLQNSFEFKQFDLSFLLQFTKQIEPNYYFGRQPGVFSSGNTFGPFYNEPIWVLQRWQATGDVTNVQKFSTTYPLSAYTNSIGSNAGFSDASYIRLKNVSIGWSMPESWLRKAHLRAVRVYMQGQNMLTITKFKGLDPENISTINLPPLKVYTLGFQIGL